MLRAKFITVIDSTPARHHTLQRKEVLTVSFRTHAHVPPTEVTRFPRQQLLTCARQRKARNQT